MNGDIAQLGERLPCTQEVSGSIPLISTNLSLLIVFITRVINNDDMRKHVCLIVL